MSDRLPFISFGQGCKTEQNRVPQRMGPQQNSLGPGHAGSVSRVLAAINIKINSANFNPKTLDSLCFQIIMKQGSARRGRRCQVFLAFGWWRVSYSSKTGKSLILFGCFGGGSTGQPTPATFCSVNGAIRWAYLSLRRFFVSRILLGPGGNAACRLHSVRPWMAGSVIGSFMQPKWSIAGQNRDTWESFSVSSSYGHGAAAGWGRLEPRCADSTQTGRRDLGVRI